MNYENYILDAVEIVGAWDLPEDELADAINEQARLMASVDHDEYLDNLIDIIN
jgi:hypothetical protein